MASVYEKNNRWYLRIKDANGKWRDRSSTARNKTEARVLAAEEERKARRQRMGVDPMPVQSDATVASLCEWWIANRCSENGRSREESRLGKHVIRQPLGKIPLTGISGAAFEDRFRAMEQEGSAPATINGLRRVLKTIFSKATKAGLWPSMNPLERTEARRVPKRAYATLHAEEVGTLLAAATPEWRGIFAAAIYAGLRKGEIFGLRKTDVDLRSGTITVARSYDHDTTKGGHADVIPIAEPLLPYLKVAMDASPSDLVFPNEAGDMRSSQSGVGAILRRALGWAGIVDAYEHSCRRCKGRGQKHVERHPDGERRRCPECQMALWVKPIPRHMRFHDLRHTTATLLLRSGVDVVRVQRILRHSDVRLTADTYGHLVVEDLRDAVNTIAPQGPAEASASGTPDQVLPSASHAANQGSNQRAEEGEGSGPTINRASGKVLSVREVAERLGVCAATVYRLCARNELAHCRVGSAIRVSESDLERLVCRAGSVAGLEASSAAKPAPDCEAA